MLCPLSIFCLWQHFTVRLFISLYGIRSNFSEVRQRQKCRAKGPASSLTGAFPVNTGSPEMLYLIVLSQSERKTAVALLLDVL
jgi:hypothetical protein